MRRNDQKSRIYSKIWISCHNAWLFYYGFTENTGMTYYKRDLPIPCTVHAVIYSQKNHNMHFFRLAKALNMSGRDHIYVGTIVGKLERWCGMPLGFVYLLWFYWRIPKSWYFSLSNGDSMLGIIPMAWESIHVWHAYALTKIF